MLTEFHFIFSESVRLMVHEYEWTVSQWFWASHIRPPAHSSNRLGVMLASKGVGQGMG